MSFKNFLKSSQLWSPEYPSTPESVDEEEEVDQFIAEVSDILTNNVDNFKMNLDHCMISESDANILAYDLGWTNLSTNHELEAHSISDSVNDDWTYYLGWDGTTLGAEPMQDCIDLTQDDRPDLALDENDRANDLRWCHTTSGAKLMDKDFIDLTQDDGSVATKVIDGDVIELTSNEEPTYDLGWAQWSHGPFTKLSSAPSSRIATDLTHESQELSPEGLPLTAIDKDNELRQDILRLNCWMKAIRNDMSDKHIHATVENAVFRLNGSHVPLDILHTNRHILGPYVGHSPNRGGLAPAYSTVTWCWAKADADFIQREWSGAMGLGEKPLLFLQ
ncbi:uncharacterized protein F5147DRAFT_652948 [Suillus discolor]|uniref:Uncharacterized protein n=1 Tax=Suillus discolor TaxID=1912936 RepID=A0A9P7F670_9AGAM|nr:uncharacterized protein F5147DRAFT_652948 [Suillus discolor]KAG2108226.1 hypothetical protein F5147DRAFT_652948 [Suillus discolor]